MNSQTKKPVLSKHQQEVLIQLHTEYSAARNAYYEGDNQRYYSMTNARLVFYKELKTCGITEDQWLSGDYELGF